MFKKIALAFCFITCCLLLWWGNNAPVFNAYAKEFEVYRKSNSSCAQIVKANAFTTAFITDKTGESCIVDGSTFNTGKFLSDFNAKVVFSEKIDGTTNLYAYSKKIKYFVTIGGKKVNIHVVYQNENIVLGTPIVFGGY